MEVINMLIQESDLAVSKGCDAFSLLESMDYLTEDESVYDAAMVPVVENGRIGANVIALEDIMEFCESNGIEDMGYAVSQICEASNIDPSTLAFSVQETSVIADDDMAQLAADVMSEGCSVFAKPISENSDAFLLAEDAIDDVIDGDGTLFEAFVNDDFDTIYDSYLGEAARWKEVAAVKKGMSVEKFGRSKDTKRMKHNMGGNGRAVDRRVNANAAGNGFNRGAAVDLISQKQENERAFRAAARKKADAIEKRNAMKQAVKDELDKRNAAKLGAGKEQPNAGEDKTKVDNAAKKIADIEKKSKFAPKKWISEKIAALNAWARKLQANNSGENAGIISKIKALIGKAIAFLTRQLGAKEQEVATAAQ